MSSCECAWELYEEDSTICEKCKEVLDHPKELAKELIKMQEMLRKLGEENNEIKAEVKELKDFLDHEDIFNPFMSVWWENRLGRWKKNIDDLKRSESNDG